MIIAGTVSMLKELGIADGRIFGVELPKAEADDMPRKAVVVSPAGGPSDASLNQLNTRRLDFQNYGKTLAEGESLADDVHNILKFFSGAEKGGVFLHSFVRSAGPSYYRDPDTDWPVWYQTWLCSARDAARHFGLDGALRYFGWSSDQLITATDLGNATGVDANEAALPSSSGGYVFFTGPEADGYPTELYIGANPINQLVLFQQQAGIIQVAGEPHIVGFLIATSQAG